MLISTLSPYFVKRDSAHTTKCPHVRLEGEFASVLAKFDRRQLMEVSTEHLITTNNSKYAKYYDPFIQH